MIEKSPAFKDGGLIDITFDEANPPFTYTGNSFNNANAYPPTSADKPNAPAGIASDAAGENMFGRNVNSEPTGPNSTLGTDKAGDQLYPGPGNNSFIDRPPVCTQTSPTLVPANCVPGIVRGGVGQPARRAHRRRHRNRRVDLRSPTPRSWPTTPARRRPTDRPTTSPIPANTFVGTVSDTGPQFPATSGGR